MLYDTIQDSKQHMTAFFYTAAQLSADGQAELVEQLKQICTPEEVNALQIGISYFRQLIYKDLRDTMKETLATQLYKEFTEK